MDNIFSLEKFNINIVNKDYLRNYLFLVDIISSDNSKFKCEWIGNLQVPTNQIVFQRFNYRHIQTNRALKINSGEFDVNVRADSKGEALSYFINWLRIVFPTCALPINYKRDALVSVYSHSKESVLVYYIKGIFPTSVGNNILLDYNGEDILTFPVNLSYDFVILSNESLLTK